MDNTHLPNNNPFHNNTFCYLSSWISHSKHFSPDESLTSLSPIYRRAIQNGRSPLQNTTYLIAVLLVLTLRLAVNTNAGQNTCSVFGNYQTNVMQQVNLYLALSTRRTIINTSVAFWLADVHDVVQTVTDTTVFPVRCGRLTYLNLISVISHSFQNFPHCHIQSLNVDGN